MRSSAQIRSPPRKQGHLQKTWVVNLQIPEDKTTAGFGFPKELQIRQQKPTLRSLSSLELQGAKPIVLKHLAPQKPEVLSDLSLHNSEAD